MSHLEDDDNDLNSRVHLPGIASAINPRTRRHGIQALMSIIMLGKVHHHIKQESVTAAASIEDNRANDLGHSTLEAFKIHSISADSGFDDDIVRVAANDEVSCKPSVTRHREGTLAKQESAKSLPGVVSQAEKNSKWKNLMRSQTRPELQKKPTMDREALQKLLVEAMFILQEAKDNGARLDDLSEES